MAESGQKDGRHNVAIDYLRAFVVVLVLTHHSVIAYAPYAHFDPTHYLWGRRSSTASAGSGSILSARTVPVLLSKPYSSNTTTR